MSAPTFLHLGTQSINLSQVEHMEFNEGCVNICFVVPALEQYRSNGYASHYTKPRILKVCGAESEPLIKFMEGQKNASS